MDTYCSKCGKKVIEDGVDISWWTKDERTQEYTCTFCELEVEPNSKEAICILGPGGRYPFKEEPYGH